MSSHPVFFEWSLDQAECDARCISIIDNLSDTAVQALIPGAAVLNDLFEHMLDIIETTTLPFENREYSEGEFRNSKQIQDAFLSCFVDLYPSFTKAQRRDALDTLFAVVNNSDDMYGYPQIKLSLSILEQLWGRFPEPSSIFDDPYKDLVGKTSKIRTWAVLRNKVQRNRTWQVRVAAMWTIYKIREADSIWARKLEREFIDLLNSNLPTFLSSLN